MKEWLYTKEPLDINDNMRNMILATLPFEYKKDKYIHILLLFCLYLCMEVLCAIHFRASVLQSILFFLCFLCCYLLFRVSA